MLKLIVSDLDGTLLPKGAKELSQEVFELLALLQKKRISFAVASGRAYYELKRFFRGAESDIYWIASDGALTVFRENNLHETAISKALLGRVVAEARRQGITTMVFTGKYLSYYISSEPMFPSHFHQERHHHVMQVESASEIKEPIFKISFYGAQQKALPELENNLSLVYQDETWTDFVALSAEKGKALQRLCQTLGVSAEEIMVFGDQENDVSMLRFTPNSCAMEQGSLSARAAANMRTDSVVNTLKTLLK